jgi:hypothetical protein
MSTFKRHFRLRALLEKRGDVIRRAYSLPRGEERNHLRKLGLTIRSLCRNSTWLNANVIDGPLLPDRIPSAPKPPQD